LELIHHFLESLLPTLQALTSLIGVYVILALSLNLINGMAGMFSIGHAGFWAIGAYSTGYLIVNNPLGTPPPLTFATGMVLAILFAAVAGVVLALACLRLSGDYLAIATLGFSVIVVNIIYNLDQVGAATGLSTPVRVSPAVVWLFVALTWIFLYRLQFSNFGRIVMSIREDEIAAESLGIARLYFKTMIFALGAGLAGLAGALYAGFATYLNPSGFEFDQSIKILTMVVLGGLGSLTGVTLAAVLLTLLPELLRLFKIEDFQMVFFAMILLLMVLIRPQGIIGGREIWHLPGIRRYWRPGFTPLMRNSMQVPSGTGNSSLILKSGQGGQQ
jgi:branched-chain amino acid transport system permease protein